MDRTHLSRSPFAAALRRVRRPSAMALVALGVGYLMVSCGTADEGDEGTQGRTENEFGTPNTATGQAGSANASDDEGSGGSGLGGSANAGVGGNGLGGNGNDNGLGAGGGNFQGRPPPPPPGGGGGNNNNNNNNVD